MAEQIVSIRLRLDGQSAAVKGIEATSGALKDVGRAARDAVADVAHLGGAFLVFNQLAGPIRSAVSALDAFGAAASRIDLVTRSAQQSAAAQAQLFAAAQRSRVQYTELAEVYARFARSAQSLGVSQQRLLGVTESISQAMTIGGGSAESMRAALVQLGQGLASGTLRGEELNSILEQTPRLAQAIADGMGVGVGELRKLGEQGRLTAVQIIDALEKEAPRLAQEFARIAPTLSGAFTVLKDGAALAFVEFDRGAGASRALADAMLTLGRSLGEAGAEARAFGENYGGALKAVGEVGALLLAAAAGRKLLDVVAGLARYAKNPLTIAVTLAVTGWEAAKALTGSPGFVEWQLGGAEKDLASLTALKARGMRPGEEGLFSDLDRRIVQAQARVDTLRRDLAALNSARQAPARKAIEEFRASEIAYANEAWADENAPPFPGAKPLGEVREYVKTRLSIQEEWHAKAVALAQAYANEIARAEPERGAALARQRDEELRALALRSQKELAALAEGDKEAKAAARARLDGLVALERAAGALRIEAARAAHAQGLSDEEAYTRAVLAETMERLQAQYTLHEQQYARAAGGAEREQALTKMRETAIEMARAQAQAEADIVATQTRAAAARRAAADEWLKSAAGAAEAQKKSNESLREEIETLGLSARELTEFRARKLEAAAAAEEFSARELESAAALLEAQSVLPEVAEAYRRLAAARREAAREAAEGATLTRTLGERRAQEEFRREWEKSWNEVDRMAREAFASFASGGKDAAQRIGDAVKSALLNAIYEATLRPIVFRVYASVAGALGLPGAPPAASLAGAGGAGGGVGNLLSMGNGLSNLFTGGGFLGGFSAGAASVASELALGAAFVGPSATLAGGAVGVGANLAAATGSAAGASALSGVASALPYVGLALGALALFGGDLFGGKQKPPVVAWSQWPRGSADWGIPLATPWGDLRFAGKHLGDTEAEVAKIRDAFAPIAQRDYAIAALLSREENEAVERKIAGYTTGEMKDFSEAAMRAHFARRLSLVSDAIGGWVDEIADAFSGSLEDTYSAIATLLSVRGLDGAQALARAFVATFETAAGEAIVTAQSGTFMDAYINRLNAGGSAGGKVISALSNEGESLADTFSRLVNDLVVVRDAFEAMGRAALDFGLDAAAMATEIVEAFGSREQFGQQFTAYYQQYYSQAERLAAHTANVAEQFARLGVAMPASHEAFRALIDGLDLTTAAGREMFASLIGLAPAFDAVADAAEAAASAAEAQAAALARTRRGLEIELEEARGNSFAAQSMRREDALKALDPSLRGLQQQVWDALDARQAAEALARTRRGLEIELEEARGNSFAAQSMRREDALKALDPSLRGLQQQVWDALDARQAAEAAAQAAEALARRQQEAAEAAAQAAENQARAQRELRDGWQRVADGIAGEMRRLRGEILGVERGYAAAQAEFALANAAARAGDQAAAERLPELARAVADLAGSVATSGADEAYIKARTLGALRTTLDAVAGRFGITVPAFAAGGLHAGGLRLVGEHGPELEATGPARIFSAEQTRALLHGDDLAAELRAMRRENAAQRAMIERRLAAVERHTGRTAEGVHGRNEMPVLVEVAA